MFIPRNYNPMTQLLSRRIGLSINEAAALQQRNRQTITSHLKKGTLQAFYISEGVKRVVNPGHSLSMPGWVRLTQSEVATLWGCSPRHIAALLAKPEKDDFHLSRTGGKITFADVEAFMERNRITIDPA